jgi:gliding motility-associated-like protein
MRLIILSILFLFSICLIGQGADPEWREDFAFGGTSDEFLMDMIETEEEFDLVMFGHTESGIGEEVLSNGNGYEDFWVIRQDLETNLLWRRRFGGDSSDFAAEIIELESGFLLVGSSASGLSGNKSGNNQGGFDYWVVRIDESGNKVWDQTIGGFGNDYATSVIVLPSGSYLIGGYSDSGPGADKTTPNYGGFDYWMVELNTSGAITSQYGLGGTEDDYLMDLKYASQLIIGGHSNSGISGTKTIDTYGGFDHWVIDYDWSTKTEITQSVQGGTGDDYLSTLQPDLYSPGVHVAGTSNSARSGNKSSNNFGQNDFWIYKLDSARTTIDWELNYGGSLNDEVRDLIVSPDGAVIAGGFSNSSAGGNLNVANKGDNDYLIIKIDTLGSIFWQKSYGGSQNDSLQTIYMRCDRGLYLGGGSNSDISGDRTEYSRRFYDYWVVSLDIPTIPQFLASSHCFGQAFTFQDRSELFPDQWNWNFGDPLSGNNSSTSRNPIHTFSSPGLYEVTLNIKEGCQQDTSITRIIEVYENKVLNKVDLGDDFFMCAGNTADLENKKTLPSDATLLWNTGDTTPTIVADTLGYYSLTVTSGNCSETDTLEIDNCPLLFVPNAFTPNGNDLNETWGATGLGIREYQLYIFNRWGDMIYESEELLDWWDGTYKGNPCQQDVYVYKILYKGINDKQRQMVGTVTLVRQ